MKQSPQGDLLAIQFIYYKSYIAVNLPDNFTESIIDVLEGKILDSLAANKKIKGVLLGMDAVTTTDLIDLQRLNAMLRSVAVMGAVVGIFGVTPGLAALITKTKISLCIQAAGHDLPDLLGKVKTR